MGFLPSISTLVNRMFIAGKAGMQFGDKRDLYATFGYKAAPTAADFITYYLREDIAKRIVNAPADGIWADPPTVKGKGGLDKNWEKLAKNHDFWAVLHRLDIICGLGAFAILLIGIDDGKKLDQPVRRRDGAKITYLQPYAEPAIKIKMIEQDPTSPRFGQPLLYTIDPGKMPEGMMTTQGHALVRQSFDVHWTRILHVAENTLENQLFGHSRMECCLNALYDLLKVCGGCSETFWLTANRGMQVDVDKDMELTEEDADNLSAELEEYQHQLRRFIRTRGVKISSLGSDMPDPKNTFDMLISRISAATGIPKRMLIGSEAGQLASQQDRAEWAVRLQERQTYFAEPTILRPFIYALQRMGVIAESEPEAIDIEWPEAFKLSPLERAQTSAQMARSAANMAKAMQTGVDSGVQLFDTNEARQIVGFGKHVPVFGDPKTPGQPKNPPESDVPAAPSDANSASEED